MAIYTQNQVRQLYVVNKVIDYQETDALNAGEIRIHNGSDNTMYFEYKGADGKQVRSDIINKGKILNVQFTPAAKMARTSNATVITLDSNVNSGQVVVGQDYLLNIRINQYCNISDDNYIFKYGVVRGTADMASTNQKVFYRKMALSLAKNFSREVQPLLKFYLTTDSTPTSTSIASQSSGSKLTEVTATTLESSLTGTYTGIVIDEVPQDWHLGKMEQVPVMYEVYPDEIVVSGVRATWGVVTGPKAGLESFGNGKNIADLEYFYHGERGDIYRGINWPHNIETVLTANAAKTYDMIDIHYYTDIANHGVQKQEKDISIAIDTAATSTYKTTDFITDLNTVVGTTVATYNATTPSHYTA